MTLLDSKDTTEPDYASIYAETEYHLSRQHYYREAARLELTPLQASLVFERPLLVAKLLYLTGYNNLAVEMQTGARRIEMAHYAHLRATQTIGAVDSRLDEEIEHIALNQPTLAEDFTDEDYELMELAAAEDEVLAALYQEMPLRD